MIFLFENKLLDSSVSSLYANTNYPASNLLSPFLYKKYKATTFSDTIRVVLPKNKSVDCFFYGYSNASSMTIRLYDNTSALLLTKTVDCAGNTKILKSGSVYFDKITVRIIEIDASCIVTEDLYIGGIAIGEGVYDVLPSATFAKSFSEKSTKSASDYGQVSYQYIPSLLVYTLSYQAVIRDIYHGIIDKFYPVGSGFIWIDITEDNHNVYQPMYCTTDFISSAERTENERITFNIKFLEAR